MTRGDSCPTRGRTRRRGRPSRPGAGPAPARSCAPPRRRTRSGRAAWAVWGPRPRSRAVGGHQVAPVGLTYAIRNHVHVLAGRAGVAVAAHHPDYVVEAPVPLAEEAPLRPAY